MTIAIIAPKTRPHILCSRTSASLRRAKLDLKVNAVPFFSSMLKHKLSRNNAGAVPFCGRPMSRNEPRRQEVWNAATEEG